MKGKSSNITSCTINKNCKFIYQNAFIAYINLTNITVDEDNTAYKSIDGNLYSKDGTTLIQYAIGKTATEFAIPDSVTTIGYQAFFSCTYLTSITIPNSVTSIGNDAFAYCCSLTSMTIPNSVTSIGSFAFRFCSSLASVTIGNGVTSIGSYTFYDCSNLTSVTIGNNVTSIGFGAFYYCKSLTSVYYTGTEEAWNAISIGNNNSNLTDATRYYYSETEPSLNSEGTAYDGNYWHYVDGVPAVCSK